MSTALQVDLPHDQEQRARVHRVEVEARAGHEGAVQHHQTVRLRLWLVSIFVGGRKVCY